MKLKKQSNSVTDEHGVNGVEKRHVILRHAEHLQSTSDDYIAQEVPVALSYNGQSHAVMMASPIDLRDFAIGFSVTEQIIDHPSDIMDIEIRNAAQGMTIGIRIKQELMDRLAGRRRQLSGRSGCGICGITDLAAALPKINPLCESLPPSHSVVDKAVTTLKTSQVVQQHCGAVHCAALFDANGELIAIREDVGRHNALDKLIGDQFNAIKENSEYGYFIVMSSRASHELVAKVAICGIGTLVTVSAATTLAIDLAKVTKLNLIGFVRDKRQLIYT